MKVLFLTMGDEHQPSSQVRVFQFIPNLEKLGIHCSVKPFLTTLDREKITPALISKNPLKLAGGFMRIIKVFAKRLINILLASRYDSVVVQKDVLPFSLQKFLRALNSNVVFEFDDAIWELPPNINKKPALIRWYYPHKIRLINQMIRKSKIVLVNNSYQAEYARKLNKNTAVITAPIDTDRFKPNTKYEILDTKYPIVLGWIGSPTTTYMLEGLSELLVKLTKKHPNIEVHNIGGNQIKLSGIKVMNKKWDNDNILNDLAQLDIGLMPLDNHPVNRGRLGYKMIIYMSLGIPFVAQDIGLNKTVVQNGVNGYLAGSEDDWVDKLSQLIEDNELRRKLGENGRKIAVKEYDIKKHAERYAELLYKTINKL
jgi:glycosyltransferase involved in cell wall biosynthesis